MEVAEQLSVFLENRPGVLAKVCEALGEAGVNLRALSVSDTVDHAVVRLVPSDATAARDVLERGGALVVETDVLLLALANRPGSLAEVARKLAGAGVNIEYSYGSAGAAGPVPGPSTAPARSAGEKGVLVMRVDDLEKAKAALA